MTVLGLLIPVSLLLSLAGVAAFAWAVRADQFSDPEGDAARILADRAAVPDHPVARDAAVSADAAASPAPAPAATGSSGRPPCG